MSWRGRTRARVRRPPPPDRAGATSPGATERAAPALAELFQTLTPDRRYAVLDLGPARDRHLRLLSPYARWVRFVGLLPSPGAMAADLGGVLPPNPARPYDVVLAWDVLDRLPAAGRAELVARLAEVTAPGARLYAFVGAPGAPSRPPARFTLVAPDRVAEEPVDGAARPASEPLLPAEVERLLLPFRIVHAYTLRVGLREYVAVRA